MATTVQIYPTTTAHQYWRNTTWTQDSPYTRAYTGQTSYTYLWPLPFDLSAYANKIMQSLKLKVKVDDASNTFTSPTEYLAVGLASANNTSSDAASATALNGNSHTPTISGDTWNEWDVSDAWDTLKAGTAYLVMSGNEYAVCFTNYGTVSVSDRPYLELVYDEGTVGYKHSDGNVHQCEVYYKHTDGVHRVKPYYMASDGLKEIST